MASPLNIASVSCSVGRFMDNLQTEVLEIEFLSYSKGMTTISEEDFARILLRYTTVENITGYLENVRQSIPDEKVILTLDTHNHPPTHQYHHSRNQEAFQTSTTIPDSDFMPIYLTNKMERYTNTLCFVNILTNEMI